MSRKSRPIKFTDANFRDLNDSESYLAFRGDYTGANLTYAGFARPGSAEGILVWQIRRLAYDVNGNLTSVTWPLDTDGLPSSDFEFSWTARAGYTYQ
jgi:hypothetical protein